MSKSAPTNDTPILWTPFPGFQRRALECGTFEALFGGAAGPGKTDVLIACAARYCQHKSARGLFLRTTFTDLRDVMDRMQALYPGMGARWVASEKRWEWPSGAVLELGYGANLAQVSRYLGREYTFVMFDELGLVHEPVVWTMLMSRVRSTDPTVPLRMRASANPGGAGHAWLKARFVDVHRKCGGKAYLDPETGTTRAYVPGLAKDNPALPAKYWDQLKNLPPALQRAWRDGDWDGGLGLFYPELADGSAWFFARDKLPAVLPGWWDFWSAYDWGYRHPAVFIAFARDERGHVYVLDAIYQHKTSDEEQAATIKGYATRGIFPVECLQRVYGGHDAFAFRMAHAATPETVADIFNRYGIFVDKASLDRVAGSAACRRVFASHAVHFIETPGNRRLVSELSNLVPDEDKPETPLKVDADADTGIGGDDGPDCFRYGVATVPFVPVQPLTPERETNLATGEDERLPWEAKITRLGNGGVFPVEQRPTGPEGQFGAGWGME